MYVCVGFQMMFGNDPIGMHIATYIHMLLLSCGNIISCSFSSVDYLSFFSLCGCNRVAK